MTAAPDVGAHAGRADASERFGRVMEAAFRLHPGELWPAAALFLLCLSTVSAFIVGRSIKDTLFLASVSPRQLSEVYIWASVGVAGAGALHARIAGRIRPDRLLAATTLLFGAAIAGARALLDSGPLVFYALWIGVEVMGSLTVIQFWTFASEVFDARQAKRIFGLVGAGGTVASIVAGFAISGLAGRLGAENLLYLCAALLAVSAALAWGAGRRLARTRMARPRSAARPQTPSAGPLASPHLRVVAGLTVCTFLVCTLVDYQFKTAAAAHFGADRAALAAYFGAFLGVTGLFALALQILGTGRILERLGVVAALALLPLALAAGSGVMLLAPVLWAATLTKGAENVLRYTVHDATSHLLYVPLPTEQRGRAKAFIDGIVKPGTIALTGAALILHRRHAESLTPLSFLSLAAIAFWLAGVLRLQGEYLRALRDNLRRRRLDLASGRHPLPEDAAGVLRRALLSGDPPEIQNALELAHEVPADLSAEVAPLLDAPQPRIRFLACEYLARGGALRFAAEILRRFDDPEPPVRAAAIGAFCAVAREKAVRSVRPFLSAREPEVKGAAVTGLIRHAGLDGILVAADALKELLASSDAAERAEAARVLGAIGVKSFYQPVLDLLGDADRAVRRAALAAAGAMRSPELLPAIVYRLASPETASGAAEALVAYGPGVEGVVGKVLANPREDPEVRRNAPRVLGALATPEAARLLVEHVDAPDEALRRAVDTALARAVRHHPDLPVDRERITNACAAEIARAFHALAAAEALELGEGDVRRPAGAAHLLAGALREKVERTLERVFLLLGVLHPAAELDVVHANLRDLARERRASAVEILDNVLDKALKRRLLPLLEDRPRDAKLRGAAASIPIPERDRDGWLAELLGDDSAWVAAAAACYCREAGIASAERHLPALLAHPAPYVREAAFDAARRLFAPAALAEAAAQLADDPFPPLRTAARSALRTSTGEATG